MKKYIVIIALCLTLTGIKTTSASVASLVSANNATTTSGFAWNYNTGWINFGTTTSNVEGQVYVSDNELYGYAWGENIGWISLNCANDDSCTTADYRVKQTTDSSGVLTGYAWSNNVGWINFAPTGSGVTITTSTTSPNTFAGYAWGENIGWISFAGTSPDYEVMTNWTTSEVIVPPPPPPPPAPDGGGSPDCRSYEYSEWGACVNNLETRSITKKIPNRCSGGVDPVTTKTCTSVVPTPTGTTTLPIIPPIISTIGTTTPPIVPPVVPPTETIDTDVITKNKPNPIDQKPGPVLAEKPTPILNLNNLLPNNITVDGVKRVAESKTGTNFTKIVTTAGIVGGGVAMSSAIILTPLMFADLLFLPLRLWGLLLSALGIKKRHRPWGTVYDSVTKQPIDPAYVIITDEQGKEINTSITDLDGRYGFLTAPGTYKITANKTNYSFPSSKLTGKASDEIYDNLYYGEKLEVEKDGTVITKNIPLDPQRFDWNEFTKNQRKEIKFYSQRENLIKRLGNWFFGLGSMISLISLVLITNKLNWAIFVLYILLYGIRRFYLPRKVAGSIMDKKTNLPLSFGIIRIISADLGIKIASKVTNQIGKYYCLVPAGKYYLEIEKKNDDESYTKIFTSPTFVTKNGIVNMNFLV